MARQQRSTGRRYGWRRPRWRDPAFYVALALTALAFGIQVALAPSSSGWLWWAALGVRLVLTWVVVSALVRIRVGMTRQLVAGYTEAEARADERDAPGRAEVVARTSGRAAGRALRAYWSRPR